MINFATARENMVESQVRPNDVTDRRLQQAMGAVPRELFVPKAMRSVAYMERDIEIAPGRYLIEARDFSKLIDALDVREDDLVLDIGCGTGYSSAILAAMAGAVVAVEQDHDLAKKAEELMTELGADNAAIVEGPHGEGNAKQGPYDVIFINGAVDAPPTGLFDQLKDGGRLGAIVIENGVGKARVYLKSGDVVGARRAFDAQAPVLPGFERTPGFVF